MKPREVHRILVLWIILSLVLLVMAPKEALAASVSLSPSSGQVHSLIHVSGTGFTAGATFRTYFAYGTAYESVTSGTVAIDGTISHLLNVPEIPGGSYTVRVATSFESASDVFTVKPEVDLNKTSVFVGERVIVYGAGFTANKRVTIRFDGDTVETTSTNSKGSFSDTFRIPESHVGSHEVTVDDHTYRLSTRLSVVQSISITPESGATGTKVTVRGTGFRDRRSITITFDGARVDTSPSSVMTDRDGSFTASFNVPTCINRTPEVEASDGKYTATAEFTIIASISLSPRSGNVGDEVTVTGNGFNSNRLITITFDGVKVNTGPMSVHTDGTGCFDADFSVPASTSGSHTVKADDGRDVASASFNTLASITLSPTSGPIGAEVTIHGTGFGPSKVVTIRFANEHVRTGATDTSGSFTDQFMVPQLSSGNYNVRATDGITTVSTIFTVTTSIKLSPMEGHVGTNLVVTGFGFTGAVTVKYDGAIVATTVADANGAFSVTFGAPPSRYGHHTVTVSDAINTIETTFTMESDAPPVPTLLMPENGARQKPRPSFNWQPVTDSSGVTYALQVATDSSFATLVLEKRGLTLSQYTPSREEGLASTDQESPYYWRVRAVDGAQNESAWSTSRSFYVSVFPQWAIYLLIVIGTATISVLVSRSIWRRR